MQGGEAFRVPGIGIRGRLHSAHSGDGLAGRATAYEGNDYDSPL